MSARQYNKYLWLLFKIHSAGEQGITLEEIQNEWCNSSLNDKNGARLPRQTFVDWKNAISELIGYEIQCYPKSNKYYIPINEKIFRLSPENRAHLEMAHQIWSPITSPLFVEQIHIRTLTDTATNLRAFPLNDSQREIRDVSEHYCEFEFLMAPNIQLLYQLRSLGSEIEVLHPQWLRQIMWDEAITSTMAYSEGLTIADDENIGPDSDIYADIDARRSRFEIINGERHRVLYQRVNEEFFDKILAEPSNCYLDVYCWPKNAKFYLYTDADEQPIPGEDGHSVPIPYDYARVSTGLGQQQRFALVKLSETYIRDAEDVDCEQVCYDIDQVLELDEPRYKN